MNFREYLFTLGRLISPLYGVVMQFRAWGYRSGMFARARLPVPVICIGNLTMGGTGKTPMVIALAQFLLGEGWRPAVISRGYGGRAKESVNIVSDGSRVLLDVSEAGDEPFLLAQNLPGVPVLTGSRRALPGRTAIERFGADIIVMDDGFQHLALERDLDIVLFKAGTYLGRGRVFPGGELREPLSALQRAGVFCITGVDDAPHNETGAFQDWLLENYPGRPVHLISFQARLCDEQGGSIAFGEGANHQHYYVMSGLAGPQSFYRSLAAFGIKTVGALSFEDHHSYQEKDLKRVVDLAIQSGATAIVTTEKDLVKLHGQGFALPVHCFKIRMILPVEFKQFLKELLSQFRDSPRTIQP
ncbi:MAG: tetraacyldisaccharide 4'-kinase [Proteobacteria bacterium]|nr:tetraacyldisaccharide 4'-kinase [Pseudomonadota bacterium]MBU1688616.1 tetraacyldisaccharide 4'-kinase [Pseudomonadota bacterium]